MLAETCADSVLTSRFPSLRSTTGGDNDDLESQMGVIGGGNGVQDETQAQNFDINNTHFATQQGDNDSPGAFDNNATGKDYQYLYFLSTVSILTYFVCVIA